MAVDRPVLIVGGGVAGCGAALRLAESGVASVIVEKSAALGGQAAEHGCKAASACLQCGVCVSAGIAARAAATDGIELLLRSDLRELTAQPDGYRALIARQGGAELTELQCRRVVIASGFSAAGAKNGGALSLPPSPRILYGQQLEQLLRRRRADGVFDEPPRSIAFLLCFGSRDPHRGAAHCSRVCCAYASRSARALRYLYPEAELKLFYMDVQAVEPERYAERLMAERIELIRCRPDQVRLADGLPALRWRQQGGERRQSFDYIFLCGGILPGADNAQLAELCGLQQDEDGFLRPLSADSGAIVVGTARRPMNIAESVADAQTAAERIIAEAGRCS